MPARRFFALLTESRIISAREMQDRCDIAAIAICTAEYHSQTFDRFKKRAQDALGESEPELLEEDFTPDPNDQANAMRGLFGIRPGMVMNGK